MKLPLSLAEDIGETNDLSKANPQKFKEMMDEWVKFKAKALVVSKK
jgi:3-methyladenine DNA glycosylase AlkC